MKTLLIACFTLITLPSFAKENKFECLTTKERTITLYEVAGNWKIDLNVKGKKIGGCEMLITELSDPASAQATKDLEFEVGKCQYQFDKFKSEFSVVNKGFMKINEKQKRASAFILNNSQPLFCRKIQVPGTFKVHLR